jgi:DNA-directed RNA polymerase specialized sigma24 family protein
MNFNRKNRKNSFLTFLDDFGKYENSNWLMEQEFDNTTEILYQCIDELIEIDKALILLYLDGNSHEEIAEITGMSKTNVGTRIGRIKEEIKNLVTSKK